ncbi:hypothetical protein BN2476_230037 [Paraburkholderia piptadeniae]|uniref:Uncharacterized protein n=1 Tax=Paraburkholderia piptadeniae TaxID=1701573 RepID=A0A1N7RWN0_9BURK|nr:hypothetical protein BN2476_230037 [Paraburkholderia piptadeniae]
MSCKKTSRHSPGNGGSPQEAKGVGDAVRPLGFRGYLSRLESRERCHGSCSFRVCVVH